MNSTIVFYCDMIKFSISLRSWNLSASFFWLFLFWLYWR